MSAERAATRELMVKYLKKKVHNDAALCLINSGVDTDNPLLVNHLQNLKTCTTDYTRALQQEKRLAQVTDQLMTLETRAQALTQFKQYMEAHRRFTREDFLKEYQRTSDNISELTDNLQEIHKEILELDSETFGVDEEEFGDSFLNLDICLPKNPPHFPTQSLSVSHCNQREIKTHHKTNSEQLTKL